MVPSSSDCLDLLVRSSRVFDVVDWRALGELRLRQARGHDAAKAFGRALDIFDDDQLDPSVRMPLERDLARARGPRPAPARAERPR